MTLRRGRRWIVAVVVALAIATGASTAYGLVSRDDDDADCSDAAAAFQVEDGGLRVNVQMLAPAPDTVIERFAVPRGTPIKIAFSATGEGPVDLVGHGPGGQTGAPLWNEEVSGASTAIPDSDDFHTGWDFPTSGCWTVTVERGADRVHFPVLVVD